ncbi:MAG TPA: S53 family peptidase [Acidimicrobiales bacterium]|nr:S53 family peptidase [Acidimicrobiales bacterium]
MQWVATATQAYNTFGAKLVGPAPVTQQLNLVISLRPRHQAAETAALRAMYTPGSATYHQYVTPAEWTAAYGPTASTVAAVTGYLTQHGFTNVDVLSNHLVVTATASAAHVESAFHTVISDFRAGPVAFYANTAPALVPSSLAGAVQAVLGLNDVPFPMPHPSAVKAQAGSPNLNGLPPAKFQTTYDATGTPTGSHTNIALFTEGKLNTVLSDLRLGESKNHLPVVAVRVIPVGPQSADTSGQDEFDMDTQSSTAMATTVNGLYLYNVGSLIDSQIDLAFAKFVANDFASAMSASIGGCDVFPYLDGSMVSTDVVMQEGAMQGQTLFASSGDNGDGCAFLAATGVPSSFPGTNWPASGEFITAVGGTSLVVDNAGNRIQEVGWVGSGGGISETEAPGWWTQATDPGFSAEFVTGGRAVPDIALDADPNVATPAQIYVSGQISFVGGTSLSSPLMLGSWARLESGDANRLGFAPMPLYALYDRVNPGTAVPGSPVPVIVPSAAPAAVSGFTDIVVGNNGLYSATPGYDEVTGLGAPDIAKLYRAIH